MKKRPEILDKPVPNSPFIDSIPIPLADWAELIAYVGELEVRVTRLQAAVDLKIGDVISDLRRDLDVLYVESMGEPARMPTTIVVDGKVAPEKPSATPIPATVLMDKSAREGDPDLN